MTPEISGAAAASAAHDITSAEVPPPPPPASPRRQLVSQHHSLPRRDPIPPELRRSVSHGGASGEVVVDIDALVRHAQERRTPPATTERGESSTGAPVTAAEFAQFLESVSGQGQPRPEFIAQNGHRQVPLTPEIVEMLPPSVQDIGRRMHEQLATGRPGPHTLGLSFIASMMAAERALGPRTGDWPSPVTASPSPVNENVLASFIRTGHRPDAATAGCDGATTVLLDALTRVRDATSANFHGAVGHVRNGIAQLPAARAQLARAGGALAAFIERVAANEDFQSTPATIMASVTNVAARNALAVLVPTAIRQFISYGIEEAFARTHASDNVKTTLGLMAPLLATGALALGAVRDSMAGTETTTSRRSRAIMGATTLVTGVATAATGAMPSVASLMLAFTMYTAMRDLVVQSRLRMNNPNTAGQAPDATHFALISVGYGIDQAIVNLGMSTLASPSGAAAFTHHAGVQARNALRRAAINWAGENGEDLMFQSIPAVRSLFGPAENRHALQLGIRDVGYQRNNLVNGALGPWAVRTGILSTSFGLTAMLGAHLRDPGYVNNPRLVEAVNDLLLGALNGVLYEPFANAGSGQPSAPPPAEEREEA